MAEDFGLIGRKIVGIRHLNDREYHREMWVPNIFEPAVVLVLDDGTTLFPSRDIEGNGPGALFGAHEENGEFFVVLPPGEEG